MKALNTVAMGRWWMGVFRCTWGMMVVVVRRGGSLANWSQKGGKLGSF